MLSPTPVTQRDIAQSCGVHPSTICLALRNSPSIPPETRRRIQQAAQELGYQPNAAARNLAFLRTEKKGPGSLPIAWINQEATRDHWRTDPEARVYFEAAARRAGEMGYHLEELWTREPGMNVSRLVQIARARGIESVVFPVHHAFDFSVLCPAWGEFATVGLNDLRLGEWVDLICADHYQNMETILRQLGRLGHKRIGLVLTPQFDAATNGLPHSCMLRYHGTLPRAGRVPVCFVEGADEQKITGLKDWLDDHRPEVVINRDLALTGWAAAAGAPALWVQWHDAGGSFAAGMDECAAEVAVTAVECVVAKSRRFEKGLGGSTKVHLIKGLWQEPVASRHEAQAVVA